MDRALLLLLASARADLLLPDQLDDLRHRERVIVEAAVGRAGGDGPRRRPYLDAREPAGRDLVGEVLLHAEDRRALAALERFRHEIEQRAAIAEERPAGRGLLLSRVGEEKRAEL